MQLNETVDPAADDEAGAVAGEDAPRRVWEPENWDEFERERQERIRAFNAEFDAKQQAEDERARESRIRMMRVSQGVEEPRDSAVEHSMRIQAAVREARLAADAQAAIAADRASSADLPEIMGLQDFLAVPFPEAKYLIGGLWPAGGRVVFTAYQKAGKSTTTHNLVASLADGHAFLGEFAVARPHRVALLDAELPPQTLQAWLRDQRIENKQNVLPISLRGKEAAFNILDSATRSRWAGALAERGVEVLVLDCLSPMLTAMGLDEDSAARSFLDALGALCEEAGVANLLVVHHMGHGPNRARGDSRIQDWPDANWKQHRTNDRKEESPRVFSAFGRDVCIPESRLDFAPQTRKVTISVGSGSRKDEMISAAADSVIAFVGDNPDASVRKIQDGLKDSGHSRDHIREGLGRAIDDGFIERRKSSGRGGGYSHYPVGSDA